MIHELGIRLRMRDLSRDVVWNLNPCSRGAAMRVAERLEQRESAWQELDFLIAGSAKGGSGPRPSRYCGWASFIARPALT